MQVALEKSSAKIEKLELARRKGETLYHSFLSASPDVITITDLEGRIQFSSERALKMFGYTNADEFIGHLMLEYVDPSCHQLAIGEIGKMLAGHLSGAAEYTGIRADGSKFDIEVNGEIIRDERGQPSQMIFVTRDITDRKETERKLQNTEERFRNLIENLNDVVYEVSSDGIVKYVSPSVQRVLGYEPEELTGLSFFQFMHEEDRPMIMQRLAELDKRDYEFLEYRYYTKNREIKWVRSSTNPVKVDGVLTGGRGVLIDITATRKALDELHKFSSIAEKANFGVAIATLDGIMLFSNDCFARMHGWEVEEVTGRNLSMFHSSEQMVRVKETIEMLKMHGEFESEEVWRTRKDGSSFPSLMNAMIVVEDGVPQYMWATVLDITEIKEKELQIRELNAGLEERITQRTAELETFFNVAIDLLCIADTNGNFRKVNKAS